MNKVLTLTFSLVLAGFLTAAVPTTSWAKMPSADCDGSGGMKDAKKKHLNDHCDHSGCKKKKGNMGKSGANCCGDLVSVQNSKTSSSSELSGPGIVAKTISTKPRSVNQE
ncbi:MAG: hypothetical protein IEMM0002_0268 [bacterium]|nr:MAG: hypothetical protein IEMM0002_0268 [bacterium]